MRQDLRHQERLLLDPPIDCLFGSSRVVVGDLSGIGARLRHDTKLDPGSRAPLHLAPGLSPDSEIVWCQPSVSGHAFESGARLYGEPQMIRSFLDQLANDGRTSRVDERRGSGRYVVKAGAHGTFDGLDVRVCDLSSKGARIASPKKFEAGTQGRFVMRPEGGELVVDVAAEVAWCKLQSIWGEGQHHYDAGLSILELHGLMRAAIGLLSEKNLCVKDTRSLIVKSRLEALDPSGSGFEDDLDRESGGRISLVRRVRNYLEKHPIDRDRWLARADETVSDPMIRGIAGPIHQNREALAIWEYLDRSVDPSLLILGLD